MSQRPYRVGCTQRRISAAEALKAVLTEGGCLIETLKAVLTEGGYRKKEGVVALKAIFVKGRCCRGKVS